MIYTISWLILGDIDLKSAKLVCPFVLVKGNCTIGEAGGDGDEGGGGNI